MSANRLAPQLNVPQNRISQIIAGKRAITGDTALRLGHWFRTTAEFWINVQSAFDMRLAEQEAGGRDRGLPAKPDRAPPEQPGLL